jgi:aryl-alcohol dehydrogenase-like predicted oxidoreductase
MRTREVAGTEVSAIALGAMMFGFIDASHDKQSIRTLHECFDAGITLVDTALCYTSDEEPQHGERVLAEALRSWSGGEVRIATKGGHFREGNTFPKDGRPESIKAHCERSLRMLGTDSLWLYYLHWPDPDVPIAESMGAYAELRESGKVQHVGISNVSVSQLREAQSVVPVSAVQNAFSLLDPSDRDVLTICSKEGIGYLPYSPLGGYQKSRSFGNLAPAAVTVAGRYGVTPQQVGLAWVLAQGPTVVPLVGATRSASIVASAAATELVLSPEDLAELSG